MFFASDSLYFSLLQVLSTFLCFCKGKIAKESSPRPLLKKGSADSTKTGGIFAFKAKMLPTNDNLHNDPPIKRTAFFGAGLLLI